jgi:pyruvate dehydrogenase E2 component (dihydrolipoamide acetyltransferase)
MEALSPTMEEGQLVKWLKSEGDDVAEGDVLAEIETDKATMELVARGSGVLRRISLSEGGTAPVGQLIGVIANADEDIDALLKELGPASEDGGSAAGEETAEADEEAEPADEDEEAEPAKEDDEEKEDEREDEKAAAKPAAKSSPERRAERAADKEEEPRAPAAAPGPDGRVKASPLARRLAAEKGIALESIAGSGPGGRIIKRDVETARAAPSAPAVSPAVSGAEYEDVPVSQMRKTIAKRLIESIGPVPTFYLTVDVDMTRMLAARERANRMLESRGVKASINDFVIRAVAAALAKHPDVNASWRGDAIRRHNRVHIGVAVAVEDGLITPVIRDANVKGVADIATEVRELAGRAREKKLKPDEYTGATFSISNLGMFGIEEFTAIINPPEACILAIGQVEDRIVAVDGQPAVQPRMRMTMSCDHRVVDGATGARFLQTLKAMLDEPAMIVV